MISPMMMTTLFGFLVTAKFISIHQLVQYSKSQLTLKYTQRQAHRHIYTKIICAPHAVSQPRNCMWSTSFSFINLHDLILWKGGKFSNCSTVRTIFFSWNPNWFVRYPGPIYGFNIHFRIEFILYWNGLFGWLHGGQELFTLFCRPYVWIIYLRLSS